MGGKGAGKPAAGGRAPSGGRPRWAPRATSGAELSPESPPAAVLAAELAELAEVPSEGSRYPRDVLLEVYGVLRAAEPQSVRRPHSEAAEVQPQPEADPAAPPPAAEPGQGPSVPSSPAQLKKVEKPLKRLSSSSKMDPNAEAFVPAQQPATPSGAQPISLAAAVQEEDEGTGSGRSPLNPGAQAFSGFGVVPEMPGPAPTMGGIGSMGGMAGMGGLSPEMMHYLYSMAMPPPPMPPPAAIYGAAQPGYTTVMLRNIPNRYSRDMLIDRLNEGYKGQYDFVYLPIDFNSKCNVGYAFINFRLPAMAQKFMQEFHGVRAKLCLPGFSSKKICEVSYATVQGREANMENFRDEKFIEKLKERPEWHPLFFDGSGREIPLTKVLGASARKRRSSGGTPVAGGVPGSPTPGPSPFAAMLSPLGGFSPGFMMPTPFGMMPTSPYAIPPAPPPTPPTTLAGVLPQATPSTMLMLKNVPTSFDRGQLIKVFNERYKGTYDFLYLPGDFHTANGACNRGFVFINFRSPKKAQQFAKDFHDKKMSECFAINVEEADDKVCEVQQARLQSLEKSIERLQAPSKENKSGATLMEKATEKAAWYPLMFTPDGSPHPFPLLTAQAGGVKVPGTPSSRR